MKIDGPKYRNPVVLKGNFDSATYTSLLSSLPEYRYKNRIVGFSNAAVYVCVKRVARSGYYEMHCDAFDWAELSNLSLSRKFSFLSVLIGVGMILLGVILFFAGWVWQTHEGIVFFWMPFLAPIAGLGSILGSRRLRLTVTRGTRVCWWVAPPLFQHEVELRQRLLEIPYASKASEGG